MFHRNADHRSAAFSRRRGVEMRGSIDSRPDLKLARALLLHNGYKSLRFCIFVFNL
jgi:hypothetical protein